MSFPAATAFYASLLALLFVFLSGRVALIRREEKTGLGTGSERLARAIRAQGNFAEYTPFAVLLIGFVELSALPPVWLVHVLAFTFLTGRLLHAWNVSRSPENYRLRAVAMRFTFFTFISCAGILATKTAMLALGA